MALIVFSKLKIEEFTSESFLENNIENYGSNFEDKEIVDSDSSEQIVRWDVSCVCASERRRFNNRSSSPSS